MGAIVSSQAAAAQRGVVCLSMMAADFWGMSQYQDPGGSLLSPLPEASIPNLSLSCSSPLCSPFAKDPCLWLYPSVLNSDSALSSQA